MSSESSELKKLALLRILQIFQKYSDKDHPLKQKDNDKKHPLKHDIETYLKNEYGIEIERKAIGRYVALLKKAGYQIESSREGSYLAERDFTDAELRMLIDSVLACKHIPTGFSKEIIDKLCALSNKYFKSHHKHIHMVDKWDKSENQELFLNIEIIDEAIEKRLQISFDYNKYGADKKLHKTHTHRVSPYQLILHNQRYYLMGRNEKWQDMGFYRLDKIKNMSITEKKAAPIRKVPGYENGINYRNLSTELPYLFNDTPERIELIVNEVVVDDIIDWFGKEVRIEKCPEDEFKVKVSLIASPMAMEYWAMQYVSYVEVRSPASLRENIKSQLINGAEIYKDNKSEVRNVATALTCDLVDELAHREAVDAVWVKPYEKYSVEVDGKKTESEGPVVILKVWD